MLNCICELSPLSCLIVVPLPLFSSHLKLQFSLFPFLQYVLYSQSVTWLSFILQCFYFSASMLWHSFDTLSSSNSNYMMLNLNEHWREWKNTVYSTTLTYCAHRHVLGLWNHQFLHIHILLKIYIHILLKRFSYYSPGLFLIVLRGFGLFIHQLYCSAVNISTSFSFPFSCSFYFFKLMLRFEV